MGSTCKGIGANSFLYEKNPIIYMEGNNENDRVASPESVPMHLKITSELKTRQAIRAHD